MSQVVAGNMLQDQVCDAFVEYDAFYIYIDMVVENNPPGLIIIWQLSPTNKNTFWPIVGRPRMAIKFRSSITVNEPSPQ